MLRERKSTIISWINLGTRLHWSFYFVHHNTTSNLTNFIGSATTSRTQWLYSVPALTKQLLPLPRWSGIVEDRRAIPPNKPSFFSSNSGKKWHYRIKCLQRPFWTAKTLDLRLAAKNHFGALASLISKLVIVAISLKPVRLTFPVLSTVMISTRVANKAGWRFVEWPRETNSM